jgi:prepilin-type N-terminal cleavage/methylation domain-containing protein
MATSRRRGTDGDIDSGTDGGFTLIEVLVSIALISIMMGALTTFFANTGSTNDQQTDKQMAVQLTDDAAERVRAIKGSGITEGRDQTSAEAQWAAPVAGVLPYLADMQNTWDGSATFPDGASATLPTSPTRVTVNDLGYDQNWYIGTCWQPPAGGDCGGSHVSGYTEFFRVVIAVTWPERHCLGGQCSFVSATLVSSAADEPVFNPSATAIAPALNNPGTQVADVGVPVGLQLAATNGAPPLTWSATGLPPGLGVASNGLISGTPTTVGTYSVNATVTDGFALVGSAVFSWVVNPAPVVTNPGAKSSQGGLATSLTLAMTGGTPPLTWSVTAPGTWGSTGLPPGLVLNAATGVISGVPNSASASAKNVTVKVTDAVGGTSTATFSWAVPPLSVQNPGAQTDETSAAVTQQVTATGGVRAYAWTTAGLPPGLAIDSTGLIAGTPTTTGTYAVTVTATDAAGSALGVSFSWKITAGPTVTTPAWAPPGSSKVGDTINLAVAATGGSGGNVWSATDLPGGLTINSATGTISGKITSGTRYLTTIQVVDSMGGTDTFAFVWNVTANGTNARVTAPTGDRADHVGAPVSFTATASGGSGYSWTGSSGLPPGVAISGSGVVSGALTTAGVYTVSLVVRNSSGSTATFMFTWTVT